VGQSASESFIIGLRPSVGRSWKHIHTKGTQPARSSRGLIGSSYLEIVSVVDFVFPKSAKIT
jgi:hypothetical protein